MKMMPPRQALELVTVQAKKKEKLHLVCFSLPPLHKTSLAGEDRFFPHGGVVFINKTSPCISYAGRDNLFFLYRRASFLSPPLFCAEMVTGPLPGSSSVFEKVTFHSFRPLHGRHPQNARSSLSDRTVWSFLYTQLVIPNDLGGRAFSS